MADVLDAYVTHSAIVTPPLLEELLACADGANDITNAELLELIISKASLLPLTRFVDDHWEEAVPRTLCKLLSVRIDYALPGHMGSVLAC